MKNLRKALALFTAVATMSVSVSAFADELSASGNFNQPGVAGDYKNIAENAFDVTLASGTAEAGKQMSFLVLDSDTITDTPAVNDGIKASIEAADILFIDQKEAGAEANTFSAVINPARIGDGTAESIPLGKYPVRVGYYNNLGQFTIATAIMEVTEGEEGKTITIKYGDITCDELGELNIRDLLAILGYGTSSTQTFGATEGFDGFTLGQTYTTTDGKSFKYGDINCDKLGELNIRDGLAILGYGTGSAQAFGEDDYFVLGATYDVVVPAE